MIKSLLLDEERLAQLNIHIRWLFTFLAISLWAVCWRADVPLPHVLIAQAIATLAIGNALIWIWQKSAYANPAVSIPLGLGLDMWSLTELLFLTGGASNPLTFLYLVPVLFAALMCSTRFAWALSMLTIATYLLIYFFHLPIVSPHWLHQNLQLHFIGMWLTFGLISTLICVLVTWLMHSLKEREVLLRLAYRNQMRDENMLWLGMNAANLAHKMSTPMNNLYLLLDELKQDARAQDADDLALMRTQLEECTDILHSLRRDTKHEPSDVVFESAFATHLARWQNLRPQVQVDWKQRQTPPTAMTVDPLFWPAVFNILNNAADAGDNHVEVITHIQDQTLVIEIINRSGSLPQAQLEWAGLSALPSQKPSGLGLGMKLSHATFEKLGGSLSLSNQQQGGVRAVISLPLAQHE